MEEILKLTANYAFPIVITFYLLFRLEVKFEQLNASIVKLSEMISRCSKQ